MYPDDSSETGVDDAAVRAAGKVSEALEMTERARGHLAHTAVPPEPVSKPTEE
jgi:hypothetical protein